MAFGNNYRIQKYQKIKLL